MPRYPSIHLNRFLPATLFVLINKGLWELKNSELAAGRNHPNYFCNEISFVYDGHGIFSYKKNYKSVIQD